MNKAQAKSYEVAKISIQPFCEVHSSKFKPHLFGDLDQTAVEGIMHSVFSLGVRKDPFKRVLVFCVKVTVFGCTPGIISHFLRILPNVARNRFYTGFGAGAYILGGTLCAN